MVAKVGTLVHPSNTLRAKPSASVSTSKVESTAVPFKPTRSWVASWCWELLTLLINVCCIAGVVAFLAAIDGKPYSHWHLVGVEITPNTMLSIIATLARSSLVLPVAEGLGQLKWNHMRQRAHPMLDFQTFDEASRGPIGALKLLWCINFRACLASFGAFVLVLAVGVDPPTNNILTIYTLPTNATNVTASIAASRAFNLRDESGPMLELNNAIARGLYAPTLQVDYSCPSGSCTWPEFDSLALCSVCEDVSEHISVHCTGCAWNYNVPNCTYKLPNGFQLEDVWGATADYATAEPMKQIKTGLRLASSTVLPRNDSGAIHSQPLPMTENGSILEYSSIQFAQNYSTAGMNYTDALCGDKSRAPSIKPTGYQCGLQWCKNTYSQTSFNNGSLSDVATSSGNLTIAMDQCFYATNNFGILLCPAYSPYLPTPTTESLENPNAISAGSPVFWINAAVSSNIQNQFKWTFEFDGEAIGGMIESSFYNANGGNISQTMQNIALSMTTEIRQGPEARSVSGSAIYPIVYVRVRWAWLTYFVAVTVLSAVFLLSCIVTSSMQSALIWKTSMLAVLFHGFRGTDFLIDYMSDTTTIDNPAGMTKCARSTKIYLDVESSNSLTVATTKRMV